MNDNIEIQIDLQGLYKILSKERGQERQACGLFDESLEETMRDKERTIQKIGFICSIVQIVLSIICLLCSNISRNNKEGKS